VDVDLQRLDRRARRLRPPEGIDELLARDRAVRAQQEDGEQRALLRPSELDLPPVDDSLDRAKDAELRGLSPPS
jgi:hypothetical protein